MNSWYAPIAALASLAWLCSTSNSVAAAIDETLSAKNLAEQVRIDQRLGTQLPLDTMVIDEAGVERPLRTYFNGRPVILNFVYYRCPMLCNQVLNGLLKTSQGMDLQLEKDYEIVSLSIDARETSDMAAAKKQRYVSSYRRPGGDAGWNFLTAGESMIKKLTSLAGFHYVYQPETDQFAHASGVIVVTPDGRLSHYFYGIDYSPKNMRLALVESSAGKIGSLADQFLLLCFHYDPTTGKYGLAIARTMQIAGVITILTIGSFLTVMVRKERRRTAHFRERLPGETTADHSLQRMT